MEGYSPDHIAAILSLLECPSSDLGDYLEESINYDSDETKGDGCHSDDHVEEEVLGCEGEEAIREEDHKETDVPDLTRDWV
ncbi:UNVERIFIED_CONTAM: hypothetical protein Sradi_2037800 [Sesamum radiatum]|uniref:Uncharacterized protein n=1 Tax=Sesamum radiatum TaxID=300843 RepID=A0AAW2TGR0_SESRA